MRCLSCERHTLFRIVIRFSREAVVAQRHVPVLKYLEKLGGDIGWEVPELKPRSMKGGVAFIIVDKELPNLQKRTMLKVAKEYKRTIKELTGDEDIEEGFIQIFREDDAVELIDYIYEECKI